MPPIKADNAYHGDLLGAVKEGGDGFRRIGCWAYFQVCCCRQSAPLPLLPSSRMTPVVQKGAQAFVFSGGRPDVVGYGGVGGGEAMPADSVVAYGAVTSVG